jgi:hypothetical protein
MEDLAYKYGIHHFLVLMHGDVWYTHIWHFLDFYYLMHMVGMLVDAHGWNIGGFTWLAYWYMHMVGISVDAHVDILIEACG